MSVPPGFESRLSPVYTAAELEAFAKEVPSPNDPIHPSASELIEFMQRVATAPPRSKPTTVFEDEIGR